MTKKSLHTITCSACKKTYKKEVEDLLNEDSLEFVMSWEVFKQTCPHCNEDFSYRHPVIYRDKEKKFVVCYAPDPVSFVKMIDMCAREQLSDDETIYRVVPASSVRFIEKVGLLTLGYDDVVMEVYKEVLYENIDSDDVHDILVETDDECTRCGIIVDFGGDNVKCYQIDAGIFNNLTMDVKNRNMLGRPNDYVVNRELALKIMHNKLDLEPLHIAMLKEIEEHE